MERKHPQPTAAGTGLSHRVPADFLWKAATAIALALVGVILLGIVALAANVLLATFAGLLLATFLLALRDGLARHTPLSPGWALTAVILLLSAAFLVGGWLLAPRLATQVDDLGQRLPQMAEQMETYLRQSGWGKQLLQSMGSEQTLQSLQEGIGSVFSATIQTLGLLITFVAVGLFIAANPALYSQGLIHLLPLGWRGRGEEVLAEIGATLRWFLVARAIAMLLVGASTAIALLLLDIPLALLLGVIATLLTFVPYLGPIAAGVPIVLVALLEGPQQAFWALIVYTVIQQIEGVLFDPLILQRIIRLAPVVTIVSQMLGGVLLGVLGIALATPFAAVMQVLIRRVYREDILGEPRGAGSG